MKSTTEHIALAFSASERGRLFLLIDCMSPVTGFEAQHEAFFHAMRQLGLGLLTSLEAGERLGSKGAPS